VASVPLYSGGFFFSLTAITEVFIGFPQSFPGVPENVERNSAKDNYRYYKLKN
jgi:hypothetical protein